MTPTDSANSIFNITYFKRDDPLPPPIQREGNKVTLNYQLTIPEATLLAFLRNMIQLSLNQNHDLIYLGTSEKMQCDFNQWVEKKFTTNKFTTAELNLNLLVSSIWMKTKTFIENTLKIFQNQESIQEEEWQSLALNTEKQFHLKGLNGKVFTVRQATFLITALDNIK